MYLVVTPGETLRSAEQTQEVETTALAAYRPFQLQWVTQNDGGVSAEEGSEVDTLLARL